MADLYVQVATDGAGKKVQTYENTVNSQTVEAQAVVLVTTAGTPIPLVDNAAFTDGTTGVVPVGFILDETAGTALTENDTAAARVDSKRAQVVVLEDGTTRGSTNRATVKAASTAAAATDPSIVVSLSPNNGAKITDGTSTAGVTAASTAAVAATPGLVVSISPNTPAKIWDGTTTATVTAASTAAVAADKGLVVSVSPNTPAKLWDGTSTVAVKAASTAVAAADPALVVAVSPNAGIALGNTIGKTLVMKTGTLASSAVTADQVVLTYTTTTGKTFFIEYLEVMARLTTFATTATLFGTVSLELPSGTKVWTTELVSSGTQNNVVLHFSDPIFATTTQVVRVVCTPSAVTAFTFRASFGGYER